MEDLIKVNQISADSYLVGNNETSLIESNIIYVIARGEQTDELSRQQEKINSLLAKKAGGKINYLIDLNNCGKNSPEARAKWRNLSEDENTDKVAVYGMHPVAKVIASYVMRFSKKKSYQFFSTREEALIWLKNS